MHREPPRADAVSEEPSLFVWPPVHDRDRPIAEDEPTDDARALPAATPPRSGGDSALPARVSDAFRTLETELLGERAVSFGRWADAHGWARDAGGAFCWRCAGTIGAFESDGAGCADCRGKRLAWDRALRLGRYEGGLRAGVMEHKFGRWRRTGREIGRQLGLAITEQLVSGQIQPGEAVLVPVPMSWRRRMSRGIDHTAVLARAASAVSGVRTVRLLGRSHRKPQVGLSAGARAANVRGSFVVRARVRRLAEETRLIIVLDDVRTTGATMTAACRAVRIAVGSPVAVWGAVACVADDREDPRREDQGVGARPRGATRTLPGGFDEKFDKTFGVVV